MHVKSALAVVVLLAIVLEMQAQNFDADSIYYTPIPVPTVKPSHQKMLRDTVTEEQRFTYFFNLQVGTLFGCHDCDAVKEVTFTTSTTHGVSIGKKFRTGIGIGFDTYDQWQTLPLFGSISWDILGTKNTNALFVQLQYGWSNAWQNQNNDSFLKSTEGGRMADIQFGYRIKHEGLRISFTMGAKFQRVYSHYEYWVFEGPPNTTTIQQDMSRMLVGVVVGWK